MSQANALEQLMLQLINEERAAEGLQPLKFNGDLNEASEDHSDWMLAVDIFSHTGENGSSAGDRIVGAGYKLEGEWAWGENIAWQSERGAPGLEDDVRDLHESLMNSPGHRANILDPDFDEIGIGIERGDFGNFDSVMVTQNFAYSEASAEPELASPTPVPTPSPEPSEEPSSIFDAPAWEPQMTEPDQPIFPSFAGFDLPIPSFPAQSHPVMPISVPDSVGPPIGGNPLADLLGNLFVDIFEFTPASLQLPDLWAASNGTPLPQAPFEHTNTFGTDILEASTPIIFDHSVGSIPTGMIFDFWG